MGMDSLWFLLGIMVLATVITVWRHETRTLRDAWAADVRNVKRVNYDLQRWALAHDCPSSEDWELTSFQAMLATLDRIARAMGEEEED